MLSMLLGILMVALLLATVASLGNEGLWSNMLTLINVVLAGLLAWNFFEPLADKLGDVFPGPYFWDVICLWGIFGIAVALFKSACGAASTVKVKFIKQLDLAGGYILATITGWVIVCFTLASLHMAPLSRNFLWGGFQMESRMLMGTAPDRLWLGFMQQSSEGAFGRMVSKEQREKGVHVFDGDGTFMLRYGGRREKYATTKSLTGKDQ